MPVDTFKVLVEGYARREGNITRASSSVVFIEENGVKVIVDPGMNRKRLLEGLKSIDLSPTDIDYVVLTNNHLDHSLLAGIFENAVVLDDEDTYSWDGRIGSHDGRVPGTSIEILKTPGHALFHCSVLFEEKGYDRVCAAGDLFWWRDEEKSGMRILET